jgi:pimeloyl-ACP methyl ester carboxylesterase
MPKVKVDDIQMYYEMKGEGFPLMMITGLGASIDSWPPPVVQGLSKNFKIVMFDNRGAGSTDVSYREYTIRLFADDTAGLMDALVIPRAHVLGISMGGYIAQELAINYPEKVEKLVLCSTHCGGTESIPRSPEVSNTFMRALTGGLPAEEGARLLVQLGFTKDFINKNPGIVDLATKQTLKSQTSRENVLRQATAIKSFNTFDRLSRIRAPTLVLHGKQDILVPPENGSILAKAIPNAKLVHLENSAHSLIEDMEEMIHSITEFLL